MSEAQALAKTLYAESLRSGEKLTGADLGRKCDRTAAWGRNQLAKLRKSDDAEVIAEMEEEFAEDKAAPVSLVAPDGAKLTLTKDGYLYRQHPSRGRMREHRYQMELKLGRQLQPNENVHHINGIRHDNRIENLELWTRPQPVGIRARDALDWAEQVVGTYGEDSTDLVAVPVGQRHEQTWDAKFVVWLGFLFGLLVSVAANVASANGGILARITAGFAPVALLLAVEALSRPAWYRKGIQWWLARFGGTTVVALVAAAVSYGHQKSLLVELGETPLNAAILPLAVDGLIMTCAAALMAMRRPRERF